jgi:hypothetical protein
MEVKMDIPKIDKRRIEDIYRELNEMIPNYVPEWRFNRNDPDPGTALFVIFSEMFQETIDRLNRVPLKNYLAFLNMLEIDQNSIIPATGFAQFKLATGMRNKVFIPSDTKLYSDNAENGGDRIIFETIKNFFATPARIMAIFNVDPLRDRIVKVFEGFGEKYYEPGRFVLFDTEKGENLQQHAFYFSENSALDIKSPSIISVKFENTQNPHLVDIYTKKLSDTSMVEWSYFCNNEWKVFDKVMEDTGNVVLYKNSSGVIPVSSSENSIMPIRCCSKHISALKEILINGIKVASRWNEQPGQTIVPDDLFTDLSPIEADGGYCFGIRFYQYNCMYIRSDEVFTKRGALVEMALELDFIENEAQYELPELEEDLKFKYIMDKNLFKKPQRKIIDITRVISEYWNGKGWVKLRTESAYEGLFTGEKGEKHVAFVSPEDISSTMVNSVDGYWIRFRILDISNIYSSNSAYKSPWLKSFKLRYDYKDNFRNVEFLGTSNNSDDSELIDMKTGISEPVRLLSPLPNKGRAVYICFDEKPVGIPINMYFQVISKYQDRIHKPVWSAYCNERGVEGWADLRLEDGTYGFSRSGNISIESGYELVEKEFFGRYGFWFKIESAEINDQALPIIDGAYMNVVAIVQRETYRDERFQMNDENLSRSVNLANPPVIDEEVWINETGTVNDDEIKSLVATSRDNAIVEKDENGDIRALWIKWSRSGSLFSSGKDDRHYVIDRTKGIIYFGDGKNGRSVPEQPEYNIKVDYHSGGGTAGNLREGMVNGILNALPYIDSVRNINPTCGGCNKQELGDIAALGPALLRNRNRAVTAADYENIIRYNFNDARKVKCFPNIDRYGEIHYGDITIVVMCRDFENEHYVLDLCENIRLFLLERAFCGVAEEKGIQVVPPQILNVNVRCDLAIEQMEMAMKIEKEVNESVERYLDPFDGFDGKGWDIGIIPKPAQFYSSIKKIDGIRFIKRINLDGSIMVNGEKKYIVLDKPVKIPFIVPVNGVHKYRLGTEY